MRKNINDLNDRAYEIAENFMKDSLFFLNYLISFEFCNVNFSAFVIVVIALHFSAVSFTDLFHFEFWPFICIAILLKQDCTHSPFFFNSS